MLHKILHECTIILGTGVNSLAIYVILWKTPRALRAYSLLLLNTCIIELLSVLAHFFVNGRLFFSSSTVVTVSDGPCRFISEQFCSVVTDFMNLNMIHSGSLVALSFWYRTRILLERAPPRMISLQIICILLFLPHALHIAGVVLTTTPRNALESIIDRFYNIGYSKDYGLYGYNDVTEPVPGFFMGYTIVFPLCVYSYTAVTRYRLLSMLRVKAKNMSEKTRNSHESLAKALTIHAILPVFVMTPFTLLTIAQIVFDLHSIDIEGLEYDFAVMPALINPALTLYFVRPYAIYLSGCGGQRTKVETISARDTSMK